MALMTLFASAYGRRLLWGYVIACAVGWVCFRRQHMPWRTWLLAWIFSLVLGIWGARLYHGLLHDGWSFATSGMFRAEPYGYAFCGAALGTILAGAVSAWLTGISVRDTWEAMTLPGLVMVLCARLAEGMSDFGWGAIVNESWMQRPPIAVLDPMWQEWHLAVFNLEALCAFSLCAVLVIKRETLAGRLFPTALNWWAMTQIFCESLRVETLKWGFVRVQQVQCAVLAAAVLLFFTRKAPGNKRLLPWCAFLAGVCLVVLLEFALDKCPWPRSLDYAIMALVLGGMGWTVQWVMDHPQKIKWEEHEHAE